MPRWWRLSLAVLAVMLATAFAVSVLTVTSRAQRTEAPFDRIISANAGQLLEQGRQTFRFDTFGNEAFWGGTLQLHRAIAGSALGGVGPGVSPTTALSVGLKVDVDAIPEPVLTQLRQSGLDLNAPATTLALLRLNAVVGLTGFFDSAGSLTSVGIQCALCHSTVDNSFAPGIGHRLDGWAARDLNVGAIINLAPNLQPFADLLDVQQPAVRNVFNSWGPGKFDAELILDGKAFRPDGRSAATLIPPAYGLPGVNLQYMDGMGLGHALERLRRQYGNEWKRDVL